MRWIYIIVWIGCISSLYAQDSLTIVSYNVENLFDNRHDTLKQDTEFTYAGSYRWTYQKWQNKLDHIAQVIINIGEFNAPIAIGLCEVENARCLQQLTYRLAAYHYLYIHYESPDERGIDVALLYDSTRLHIIHSHPIPVYLKSDFTRDILYVCGTLPKGDTIHFFVCHLPSQRGGTAATEWKRIKAKHILQTHIDSILSIQPNASILCMGDMNTPPANDLSHMHNAMMPFVHTMQGTHKWKGIWTCLDQFYYSHTFPYPFQVQIFQPDWIMQEDAAYLGKKPFRTYEGYRYINGYSDHLPIIFQFKY